MKFSALYPELIVRDLAVASRFYCETLRFTVRYERPEESFQFLVYGDAQLMLLQDNDNPHSRTGELAYPRGQGVNFSIRCDEIDAMAERLERALHPLRIPIREQWHRQDELEHGERQLWVMDPDGYLLRFIEELGSRRVVP